MIFEKSVGSRKCIENKRYKENKEFREIKGSDYLSLGLYAFMGLGMEVVYAYLLEPVLYGVPMQEFSTAQTILHWILTCITWGIFAYVLIRKSGEKYSFPLLSKGDPMKLWQWGVCVIAVVFSFLANYMDWGGCKVYLEYLHRGALLFIFQYIYYVFETMLFLLIIIFGQKACEVWFHKTGFP